MEQIYLCDLDGTLANNNNRSPFDESKCFDDTPLPTVRVIQALITVGERIIYFSGRTEACRAETIRWLTKHVDDDYPELYMRQEKDFRKDSVIKKELYDKFIKDKYEVIGVFDDRLQVCHMWYHLGLFVFNVNQGLREF